MNIREMPSQLENIKSLLWPYGNRYVSGYQLFPPGLPVVDQTPKKPGRGKRGALVKSGCCFLALTRKRVDPECLFISQISIVALLVVKNIEILPY